MNKRELKWPWKEFPKDEMSWSVCKSQMEQAIQKLESSLMLGTLTNKAAYKKDVFEFLDKVIEPTECKETITIEEFKKLLTRSQSREPFGRFAISKEAHKKQCENLKVGDTVFFIATQNLGKNEDGILTIDVIITQAIVVDGHVSFKGEKLPFRNKLEN